MIFERLYLFVLVKEVSPLREYNYFIQGRETKTSNDFYLVNGEKLESATFTFPEENHLEVGEPELKIIKLAHLWTKCEDLKKNPLCRRRRLLAGNIHTSAHQTPNNTFTLEENKEEYDANCEKYLGKTKHPYCRNKKKDRRGRDRKYDCVLRPLTRLEELTLSDKLCSN